MINEEFEAMLKAAYGNQEIPPDQKAELRLAFLRGAALGYTATIAAVLATTATKNVTEALHAEISAELRSAGGPSIVLEPMELKSATTPVPDPEARITRLWNALAGVVGADSKEELEGMITVMSAAPVPEGEKDIMVHAMRVLLEELPTPAAE